MRRWTPGAQAATIGHLASMIEQRASSHSVDLWQVSKEERVLRCIAHYLPSGIDVRLMEGEDFRRTQLVKDASAAHSLASDWLTALKARAWSIAIESSAR